MIKFVILIYNYKSIKFFFAMKPYKVTLLITALFLSLSVIGRAQQQQMPTPEEQQKKLREYIDTEVERLSDMLDLEDWQMFYVDSTLNNDFNAMQEEIMKLSAAKVSNYDMYTQVQDKWTESIYDSYHKFFKPAQWEKYLKSGAAREQKARDKRKAKIEKNTTKVSAFTPNEGNVIPTDRR